MGRIAPFIMLALGGFALFATLTFFRMGTHADQFVTRVEREALATYDTNYGPDSLREKVMTIAREERIPIADDDLEIKQTNPSGSSLLVEIVFRFKMKKTVVSRTFEKTASRTFRGQSQGHNRLPPGFSTGSVNTSSPSRDINSHRQTIGRAAAGKNE